MFDTVLFTVVLKKHAYNSLVLEPTIFNSMSRNAATAKMHKLTESSFMSENT